MTVRHGRSYWEKFDNARVRGYEKESMRMIRDLLNGNGGFELAYSLGCGTLGKLRANHAAPSCAVCHHRPRGFLGLGGASIDTPGPASMGRLGRAWWSCVGLDATGPGLACMCTM